MEAHHCFTVNALIKFTFKKRQYCRNYCLCDAFNYCQSSHLVKTFIFVVYYFRINWFNCWDSLHRGKKYESIVTHRKNLVQLRYRSMKVPPQVKQESTFHARTKSVYSHCPSWPHPMAVSSPFASTGSVSSCHRQAGRMNRLNCTGSANLTTAISLYAWTRLYRGWCTIPATAISRWSLSSSVLRSYSPSRTSVGGSLIGEIDSLVD